MFAAEDGILTSVVHTYSLTTCRLGRIGMLGQTVLVVMFISESGQSSECKHPVTAQGRVWAG